MFYTFNRHTQRRANHILKKTQLWHDVTNRQNVKQHIIILFETKNSVILSYNEFCWSIVWFICDFVLKTWLMSIGSSIFIIAKSRYQYDYSNFDIIVCVRIYTVIFNNKQRLFLPAWVLGKSLQANEHSYKLLPSFQVRNLYYRFPLFNSIKKYFFIRQK